MLDQLIVLSLAASIGWELVRYFLPIQIPERIAPVIIILISYLMSIAFTSSPAIISFAAAGGVAIFHRITDAYALPSLEISNARFPFRRKKSAFKKLSSFPRSDSRADTRESKLQDLFYPKI